MHRARAVLMLTGALLLLVSLYLPWQETTCGSNCGSGFASAFPSFAGTTFDGWSVGVGSGAALFGLALVGVSAVALLRLELVERFPIRWCALCAGYLAVAVGVEARSTADLAASRLKGFHAHFQYGAYLGGFSACLLVLAAVSEWPIRSAGRIAVGIPAVTLLVALLLPWQTQDLGHVTELGIFTPAAIVAAALTVLCVARGERGERIALAAGAVLFTLAAFSSLVSAEGSYRYGAWLAIAAAATMLAVAVAGARPQLRPRSAPRLAWVASGIAALVVTALFLPWQEECFARSSDLGSYSGKCFSTNAWASRPGVAAGALAIGLGILALASRRLAGPSAASALGLALLVATFGFEIIDVNDAGGFRAGYGYGSYLGFAGTALLLVLTVVRVRPGVVDWRRLRNRLAPMLACAGYLAVTLLPWWIVLPNGVWLALQFAPFSWLTVTGVLAAAWLLCVWAEGAGAVAPTGKLVVLLPAGLVALTVLDLIQVRHAGITWGRVVIPALALGLLLFGWIEEREGLENFEVPEILRVDRL